MTINYFGKILLLVSFISIISGLVVFGPLSQPTFAYAIEDCPVEEQHITPPGQQGVSFCSGPVSTCWNDGMTWNYTTSSCSTATTPVGSAVTTGAAANGADTSDTGSTPGTINSHAVLSNQSYTCKKAPKFLTFPQWYRGLNVGPGDTKADCEIVSPGTIGLSKFIWRIVLNVIEIMLQAVAYIVAIMMLTAGFKLLFTEGNSDRLVNARNTITMAAVGFAISVAGVAIINIISTIFLNNPPAP